MFFVYSPAVLSQAEVDEAPGAAREYVGSGECAACHRDYVEHHAGTAHAQALIDVGEDKAPLLGDFTAGEDTRTLLLPGEEEPRPLTADDISFAVGIGKYAQHYLYETENGRYMVLPFEWNAIEGEWRPLTLSDTWPDAAYDWTTQCAGCHTTNLNIEQGTWLEDGVQCEACHGPGSVHIDVAEATDPILTHRERTALEDSIVLGLDPATCGQCHSQGVEPAHGYPFPLEYTPGEALLDRNVFRLPGERSVVHWWETGQARQKYMQFNEWVTTTHAEAFLTVEQHPDFTPGCLTCHNSTYSRAAEIVNRIEASNDRERIDILFDEADLDIDDLYTIDWETLKALTIEELELDAQTIDDAGPFLPQILPYLIEMMHAEDELVDGQILPQSMAEVLRIAEEGTNDDHTNRALGITCATCHDPHSTANHPASLAADANTLCSSCHRSAEPIYGIHHPVKQVFEGLPVVERSAAVAVPSGHFTAENGPTCATCHMPEVPVENATRISHTLSPILPAEAANVEAIQDTCTRCHGERIEGQTMQELIASIQNDTRARYEVIHTTLTELDDGGPAWIAETLQVIEGDGSWGFHNYAYTSALLSNAERELGIREGVAPLVIPEIPIQPQEQPQTPLSQAASVRGLTPPSIVLLAVAVGLLLVAAYMFFVRGRTQ